jgi:glycosyltransferase involved in cell wall biosynthesis
MTSVDVSVVVPVYNNAATLPELIDRLIAVLEPMQRPFELIFVDDGSRDGSLVLLRERAARDARVRPFALTRNFGSQAAACAGLDQVRGRRVISIDADLENCPEDIPALLEPLERGYDLVCGYREARQAPPLRRRLPSRLMNAYVRRRTGTTIRDLGCGMRGLQSWLVRDLASEGEGRRLLTPVILRRARTVTEVALRPGVINRRSGHSFLTLLGIAADYYLLTAGRPFLVSGMFAAAAVVLGAALAVFGAPLAGLVITVGGLLGALLSLVGEYCQRLYQLAQGMPFYQLQPPDDDSRPPHPAGSDAA